MIKRSAIVRILVNMGVLFGAFLVCAAERPNIVWITSEDNSTHYLRLYDEGGAAMPNVERLAESGLVFSHAYSNSPVCSTARSTIISGCYGPRLFSQHHRRSELVPMPDGLRMFPWYLRQAGYYTTNHYKEDYNLKSQGGVWDESSKKASYRNRSDGQPFFHVENFNTTHEGKLHFSSQNMTDVPTETDVDSVAIFPIHPNTPTFRYSNAYYRDLHIKLDREIGIFLEKLEEDGLMEETIIFYYGDHGGALPGSKGYAYERGLHVPMVVYVPEKWRHLLPTEVGTRVEGFVEFVDLGPTVLNLAGIKAPEKMDGEAFLGKEVSLEELNQRDRAFGYADRFDEKYDMVRTLRVGKFKYMRNYQPFNFDGLQNNYRYKSLAYQEWRDLYREGKLNTEQCQFFQPRSAEALFDIEADPFELHNLAEDPAYADDLFRLRSALREQLIDLPDLGFFPESYALNTFISNPEGFGQENRKRVRDLIAVADLSLLPFKKARKGIRKALASDDPWKRYWGLIVCSSFGEAALELSERAKAIAGEDSENLVRIRAAEFLGLAKQQDPREVIIDCIKKSDTLVEASLVLNTAAMLQDSNFGYDFGISRDMFPEEWLENEQSNVLQRLRYLNGEIVE
ncbi:sulfatase [Puniceicoccaceae bacterium K14]|nr:sulfatase [Puniceicoccaceae bacterium K14]